MTEPFDHAGLNKSLEDYLLDEANSHEVTATIAIFKLVQYKDEPEQTFRLRVVRALMWVGMDASPQPFSAGQHIRAYMDVQ